MQRTTTQDRDLILAVDQLSIVFDGAPEPVSAVNRARFSVRKGEVVGIVGESGSGKTALALSLLGLLPHPGRITEGSVRFASKRYGEVDLANMEHYQHRNLRGREIAMIFQDPMSALNPTMTCGEQVAEMFRFHWKQDARTAKTSVLSLFEEVHFPDPARIYQSFPHQLSGGQQQRVMIAMALSCQPKLIIADEPTTALDVTVQANILSLFKEIREQRETAMLFIGHDLGVIFEIADRVLVMHKGRIVEEGPVLEIFSRPKHPYTQGLMACRPRLDIAFKRLPVVSDFILEGGLDKPQPSIGHRLIEAYRTDSPSLEKRAAVMAQEPLVQVSQMTVRYPAKKNWLGRPTAWHDAVKQLDFEIYPGETLGLVGESGCGKTTVSRVLAGLLRADSGSVRYKGREIAALRGGSRIQFHREVQVVFQDPYGSLNPRMTVGEAILEPMRVHGILGNDHARKRFALELLEKVNMHPAHFSRFPGQFSGGQRQRIVIARALGLQPKFLICDEPVSALDVSVQAQVLNLLNDLKEQFGLTLLFISHDLSVVKFMADRVMVMNSGQIEEISFAEEIYENPRTPYTEKLLKSVPLGDLAQLRRRSLEEKIGKQAPSLPLPNPKQANNLE